MSLTYSKMQLTASDRDCLCPIIALHNNRSSQDIPSDHSLAVLPDIIQANVLEYFQKQDHDRRELPPVIISSSDTPN
jgi:hypothetical protein